METLDQSKDKRKDISEGENLLEALKDGIFDTPKTLSREIGYPN